ncbi:hypothetical protein IBTHAUMO2_1050005 [Nitrosopumilaceae archaeon]|nr:hypothetical protein IBTHAUMO2_1050005 [Nitrosopumilaceae archaeon]
MLIPIPVLPNAVYPYTFGTTPVSSVYIDMDVAIIIMTGTTVNLNTFFTSLGILVQARFAAYKP